MNNARLGAFALEEKLSGAGSVYRAVHLEKHRTVALKLFSLSLEPNAASAAEFAREWEVLKSLKHPHIVRCYGGGLEGNQGYLAYELIRGESLAGLLKMRRRMPWEMVIEFALQICAGLECAHEKGVVHEALAPDKLLLDVDGHVQIADLRLNRSQQTVFRAATKLTPVAAVYLAPEQTLPGPVTHKVDLYAFGCILFEMLTGEPPCAGNTVEDVFAAHQNAIPPHVATIVFDCPVWLDALVAQMLEKDPAKRPHGAAAVRLALQEIKRRVAEGTGVTEHAAGGISALKVGANRTDARKLLGRDEYASEPAVPFHETTWFLAVCLACVLAVLAGGIAWTFWPLGPEQMLAKADALMATSEKQKWHEAREKYLDPLLAKHPGSEYAARAQGHIDVIEIDQAETRLRLNLRFSRPANSEGERLYVDAYNFEQFGDRLTALEKYQSLVTLLQEKVKERPYVNLAHRQIARLQEDKNAKDRREFLSDRLHKADQLAASGDRVEAHKIWQSIVTLYASNRELQPFVERAQDRLGGKKPAEEPPTDSSETPAAK